LKPRRPINWIAIGILGCLAVAVGAYFWATDLMGSGFAYRSPLADSAPQPGDPTGAPITRKLVIVLVDALRLDTSLDTQTMPFMNELREQGAYASMHSRPPSFSAPGWNTILSGAWPEINDAQIFNPSDFENVRTFTQDDLFAAADRAGLKTAVSGYAWFEQMLAVSGVDAGFYTPGEDLQADIEVVDNALPWLLDDYQLILIHLDQVDYAGHHEGGPRDPNWAAAARRVDDHLRQIAAGLDLAQDTLLVISDHGHIDQGGHGGPEAVTLAEPFILVGQGVLPGEYPQVEMADIAPTAAALLGTNLPASNQGRVLFEMLNINPDQETALQAADLAQKQTLLEAYELAIGTQAASRPDPADAASYLAAMDQARTGRLARERVWRNVLAVFLAFTPAYLLFLRRDRRSLWMLTGALVYLAVFNFRFAVLDNHTYSLSSVEGEMWLIQYVAVTALIALLAGWLVAMLGLRAFRQAPGQAARLSLGSIWFILYLLLLPILLNFAMHGTLVTWTLPEFYILFIALLAIIQSLFVAAAGLLLTGLAAGIAWRTSKRN
jgi:hypothetical protein